jgi:hypothetical protein
MFNYRLTAAEQVKVRAYIAELRLPEKAPEEVRHSLNAFPRLPITKPSAKL